MRVGDLPVSKPLRSWLAQLGGTEQVALDPEGAWQDPSSVLSRSAALDPTLALARLADELEARASHGESEWQARWRSADELAAEALLGVLDGHHISEPAVAAELGALLPGSSTLFVASSMPVRDIESFWPVREDPPRVLCNRGANGIDGTVSSAFGAAAAADEPVVLLIGDVALAYDIGGLLAARRLGIALTIVLLDNGGGGIFDFLPVAGIPEQELYDTHVATPTGLDFCQGGRAVRARARARHRRAGLPRRAGARDRCAGLHDRRGAEPAGGQRRTAPEDLGGDGGGGQPASSGSRACSLISVSASSRAGSESRTMPLPA